MKIKQDVPQFTPITITIETREEAEALWLAVRAALGNGSKSVVCSDISNWFANESRL